MRFQVTTEDGKITEYDSFSKAGEDLELEPRTTLRFLRKETGGGQFTRRKDKKVFFIERIGESKLFPLIKIDGEEFFSPATIFSRFGLRETKFMNQLKKCPYGFVNNEGNPHKIDWISEIFLAIVNSRQKRKGDNFIKHHTKVHQKILDMPSKNEQLIVG